MTAEGTEKRQKGNVTCTILDGLLKERHKLRYINTYIYILVYLLVE